MIMGEIRGKSMKEIKWKKSIAVLMMVVFLFNMTACDNRKKQEENSNELAFEGNALDIEGMEGEPVLYCVKDGKIYILSNRQKDQQFYKADLDGANMAEIGEGIPDREDVNAFFVGNDGSITYMASVGEETEELHYELVKLDVDGKEVQRENITKSLNLLPDSLLKNIAEDENGNVILADTQRVYVLNSHFQSVGQVEVKEGCQVGDFAQTKDGQIVCVIGEEKEAYISAKVCMLDVEKCKWGKKLKLDIDFLMGRDCITDGADYDFYYKGDGIYGYNIAEKKSIKVLDSTSSYLTGKDMNGIVPAGNEKYIGLMYGMEETGTVLGVYTKLDPSVIAGKQTITYGTSVVDDKLTKAAREFCQENRDCRIEFKTYDSDDDENYSSRMLADIVAGKVPDIIDISHLGLSPEQCVEKGLLEDLTAYYENDSKVSPNDLIPSVSEGMKMGGKFYFLSPYFSINTVVGKTKDVGDGNGWTYDEVKTLLAEKGDGVMLFDTDEKVNTLYSFLASGLTDFVDWDTGECRFDSQEFRDILELCNRGGQEAGDFADRIIGFREGKILLEAYNSISLENIQTDRQIFGEDITYIGYPNEEQQGSSFNFEKMTGIYSKSSVKDKAWEFLRLVMTKEYQAGERARRDYAMPTRQDSFDLKIREWTTTEAYVDEFGREIEPLEKNTYNGIEHGPIQQEDVDLFVDLVNHTKKRAGLDWN